MSCLLNNDRQYGLLHSPDYRENGVRENGVRLQLADKNSLKHPRS